MTYTAGVAVMDGCKLIRRHWQERKVSQVALYIKVALIL